MQHDALILSTLFLVVNEMKSIQARIGEIEINTSDILSNLDEMLADEDDGDDEPDEDREAIADQLLDAADKIEGDATIPYCEDRAECLREIAKELRG